MVCTRQLLMEHQKLSEKLETIRSVVKEALWLLEERYEGFLDLPMEGKKELVLLLKKIVV